MDIDIVAEGLKLVAFVLVVKFGYSKMTMSKVRGLVEEGDGVQVTPYS